MKIKFAGAAGEVTGSKHLLTINGKKVLLDCGMFQGHRMEADEKNRNLLFDPKEIDAVILSHAHMDHSGDLPLLWKAGYRGPIFCTHATRDLCNYMLLDSAYIQEREVEWLRKKQKPEEEIEEPLYTTDEAVETLKLFHGVNYEQGFEVLPGIVASFWDAGHILGSAMVHLKFHDEEAGKDVRFSFTGDLGRRGLPILRDPSPIPECDYLITESTYGNRLHANLNTVNEDLAFVVNEVCERGGKLLIPAFALERAQEVVYHLNVIRQKGLIPDVPVYVDSPLAGNVTEVFRGHPECFDKKVYEEFLDKGGDPFGFEHVKYTRDVEESKALNDKHGPMVIIAASGMCEHGRILHHLKNNLEDTKTTVLIVGYQAENTLGRKLVNGNKEVNIFGAPHRVRASIYVMDAFSGHADRSDLLEYIGRLNDVKKIFLVHGESVQLEALKEALNENDFGDVHIPFYGEEVEIR
ncbi:MBL fold metallo-hydrolase [Candidatus Gracilibacteria bacterium]|nr:MBL fold metallo-hydrolase [Candidatus Gracilibacteria bacterium]